MEFRNGAYTSRTKSDDCETIARLARRIQDNADNPQALAKKIERLARKLADELR